MKVYQYVGPEEILDSSKNLPKGTVVRSSQDVRDWIQDADQRLDPDGCIIATFVISEAGVLRIADRHSEHVACAGQQPVLSAGEITFEIDRETVFVPSVTNQSTGYCPEPSSWTAVQKALNCANIQHPGKFAVEFVFRRCKDCGAINIVKEDWFVCIECDADLDHEWNLW